MSFRSVAAITGILLATGCEDPLDLGQVIERTRPLGVRVSSEAEPSRAWPLPGEHAVAAWWVVTPRGQPNLHWALSVCVAEEVRDGVPRCAASPFARAEGGPSSAPPTLEFAAPERAELGTSGLLAMHGVFCEEGAPVLAGGAQDAHCSPSGAPGIRVSADVRVQMGDARNQNPTLADNHFFFGGALWEPDPDPPPDGACEETHLVRVFAKTSSTTIRIELDESDREALPLGEHPLEHRRETLTVSHFSTLGELDRQFSVVDHDDDSLSIELTWSHETTEGVAPGGEVARFFFVLRDGRGGADFAERRLCLLP